MGETFDDHLALLEPLGQDLRKARQLKGLELSQVSTSLKINKRHLNAIEESNVNALPVGRAYIIGYTRAYAEYLGLNSTQCVEKLKNEIAEREATCQMTIAQSPPHKHRLPSVVRHTLSFLGIMGYEL